MDREEKNEIRVIERNPEENSTVVLTLTDAHMYKSSRSISFLLSERETQWKRDRETVR